MDDRYSEGICADGAAILFDGVPITVSEVLEVLNGTERLQCERDEARAALERLRHDNNNMLCALHEIEEGDYDHGEHEEIATRAINAHKRTAREEL